MEGIVPPAAARLLGDARRVVVFTGAGISAESGVPTFRDDLTGLWALFDAQRLATPEAFHADPDLVWGWYEWRRARARRAQPNPGHLATAAIETRVPGSVVITQNVDDLHERAGSRAPIHLHGSLFAPRCVGEPPHPAALPDAADAALGEGGRIPPPRCARCGALVRPGVVWFGEALPEAALTEAVEQAKLRSSVCPWRVNAPGGATIRHGRIAALCRPTSLALRGSRTRPARTQAYRQTFVDTSPAGA